tara:strand:+ start:15378 stop:15800 length:423 start_codon:yes stop_codon:yes gene_type:complete
MPFPTDKGVAKDLGELITLVAELKKVLTRAKQTLGTGSINADHLLEFLSESRRLGTKIQRKAQELDFGTTAQNGLEGSLLKLLQALNTVAQNVSNNLPKSGGYVLLYSVNQDFELVPREFTGASITLFEQQVDLILAEIV